MKNIVCLVIIGIFVGCSTKTNTESKTIIPEAPLLKSKTEGYFKAIGTEPFWSLEISEEMIRFQGIETENEFLVQAALANALKDRTSIVIAHRLSTIRAADQILVLDNGLIAERGKHDELLALNGMYAELYSRQSFGA